MPLSNESKFIIGSVIATIAIVVGGVFFFSRPAPKFEKNSLVLGASVTKGNPDAPVYLVEFSDFQCPACKEFKPIVDQLVEKYSGQLLYVYRYYPLSQHPFGRPAALAAIAAQKQNKFWEMYNYLFAHQNEFSQEFIEKSGQELGLDTEKFKSDMNSTESQNLLDKDLADGNTFGVSATPTFFLNGEKITLTNLDSLTQAVEKAIQSKR